MKQAVLVLFLLCFSSLVFGQSSITFDATVSNKQVPIDSYVEVSFTLKNGVGTDFKAPDFEGFDILSGPSKSISTTVINENVSRSFGYSYIIRPKSKGNLTIKAASIKVNNQWYKTNSITITAISKQNKIARSGKSITPKVFLRATPSLSKAYVGQQVVLNYELFSNVPVQDLRLEKEDDYKGFFVKNRNVQWTSNQTEIIDNIEYLKYTIKKVSLFSQQDGISTIEPLELTVLVSIPDSGDSFWGMEETKEVKVKSTANQIEILKIPEVTDDNFNGAVGNYSTSFQLSQSNIALGKPTVLKITVNGDGDPNRLFPTFLSPSDSFDVFEPKITEELFKEEGEYLISSKSIEYTIVPKKIGTFSIEPNFVYFDPYKEVFANSSCIVPKIQVQNYSLNTLNRDTKTNNNKWLIAFSIISLIAVASWFTFTKILKKSENSTKLDSKSFLNKLNDKSMSYNDLSTIVQEFLCKSYDIHTTEYVSKNIATLLIQKGMDEVKANNWQNVVMHLQANVYAPIYSSNIQEDIKQIRNLV